MNTCVRYIVTLVGALAICVASQAQDYPSSANSLIGKKVVLSANLLNVQQVGGTAGATVCVPVGSEISVFNQETDKIHFVVTQWGQSAGLCVVAPNIAEAAKGSVFIAPQANWAAVPRRVTGVSFGGLVVPFKYRLGGTKAISSSATVAPYVGWDLSMAQRWGITLTPLLSAGLALVPVTDPQSNKTETRPAMSLLTGFRFSSAANKAFTAGVVVGRDFLSSNDRKLDPTVNKTWLSLYLGYAI